MAAVWCLLFLLITAWIVYAAYNWKVPVRSAKSYWASRLTGKPQAFLGSDDRWHYFALKGMLLHGWAVGRISREEAAQARDVAVRACIDRLLDRESWEYSPPTVAEVVGVSLPTDEACQEWWQSNRERYVWPAEREAQWEQEARARWVTEKDMERDLHVREYYISEIAATWRKAALEALGFGALLLLLWPVWPWLISTALNHRRGWRRVGMAVPLLLGITAVTYFAVVLPHVCLGYGMGATTTLQGPGWLSFSGPYPFHAEYRPGNTILYRQFLELLWDPTVRLANTRLLDWADGAPLFVVGVLPYLAAAVVLGIVSGLRLGRRQAGARSSRLEETRASDTLLLQRPT